MLTTRTTPGSRFDRWSRAYLRGSTLLLRGIGVLALAAMVAVHGLAIGWRFLFEDSLDWVHEFSLIIAMLLYFLLYAEVAKQRDYVRLEFVEQRLGVAARRSLSTFIRCTVLAFHGLVAWYALATARFAAMFETTVLQWPESVFYLPLAVGCADIVVTETIHLVRHLRGDAETDRPAPQVLT